MLRRILRKFSNSLVILLGVYLMLIGLANLVPGALADINAPIASDQYGIPETGGMNLHTNEGGGGEGITPIQPLAPLEPNPSPQIVAENVVVPASPQLSERPTRLIIPDIGLNAPVVPALQDFITLQGQEFRIWDVPAGYQAGWHTDSVTLGQPGNLVLNGHHNTSGQVFARLIDLEVGSEIMVVGENHQFHYRVTEKLLLPEKDQTLEVRLANAHYILPTVDHRLTLITCWPYETNTHRLVVIAIPH